MLQDHEKFTVILYEGNGESFTWEDASDIRKNGEALLFKDSLGRTVMLFNCQVSVLQNSPTPEQIISEGGLVLPTKQALAGL